MGYSVITSVLDAAASYNLIDLATVKDELAIKATDTSNDSWLTRAIAQVSDEIAQHTKRVFPPELVQDSFDIEQDPYPWQTPGGFRSLDLSRFPVLGLVSVIQTLAPGNPTTTPPQAPLTQTLVQGVDFLVDAADGRLQRLNSFTGVVTRWEALPVTVIYTGGFGALVTGETHAVPGSPYQVTVAQAATFSAAQQVTYANGTSLTEVAANPAQGQFSHNAAGVFTFNAADSGQTLTFAYATFTVPNDLIGICLRTITGRFKAKTRDPALIQQDTPGVGTQRWWFGGAPGQRGPFPPDVEGALDNYRMPIVA